MISARSSAPNSTKSPGTLPRGWLRTVKGLLVEFGAEDLAEIIYVDHYGNAMTGLRAERAPRGGKLVVNGESVGRSRVFSDVPEGQALWYENSQGLVEIAVNRGNAAEKLDRRSRRSARGRACLHTRNRPYRAADRRARAPRLAPPSAVQSRVTRKFARRASRRLSMGRQGARGLSQAATGLGQSCVAERILPRLRGPHGVR